MYISVQQRTSLSEQNSKLQNGRNSFLAIYLLKNLYLEYTKYKRKNPVNIKKTSNEIKIGYKMSYYGCLENRRVK